MRDITKQTPAWEHFSPLKVLDGLWGKRELIGQLVRRSIESRYKGSMMGQFWVWVTPLLMLAVYAFVFGLVLKSEWGGEFKHSKTAFALIMFCGMTVFSVFSDSVTAAVGIITGNPGYVKKTVFPLETLPLAAALSAGFTGLVWLVIVAAGVGLLLHRICFEIVCLPVLFIPLALFSIGSAWFVASLGVFVRDLAPLINVAMRALFFMTPICYPIEKVPFSMRVVLALNPLTTFVETVRQVLIFGRWPDWASFGVVSAVSWVVFQSGYLWFMKTKRGFADVL